MTFKKVVVGKFGKAFGVRGWIKIHSFITPKENILALTPWLIEKNGQWQELLIEASKIQHQNIIVKLKNIADVDTVKLYTNLNIFIDHALLPKLPKNEYYWDDLIGLKVINKEGIELGIIDHLFGTGSNDVMAVKGKKEHLIPYLKNVIVKVDLEQRTMIVDWDENF